MGIRGKPRTHTVGTTTCADHGPGAFTRALPVLHLYPNPAPRDPDADPGTILSTYLCPLRQRSSRLPLFSRCHSQTVTRPKKPNPPAFFDTLTTAHCATAASACLLPSLPPADRAIPDRQRSLGQVGRKPRPPKEPDRLRSYDDSRHLLLPLHSPVASRIHPASHSCCSTERKHQQASQKLPGTSKPSR